MKITRVAGVLAIGLAAQLIAAAQTSPPARWVTIWGTAVTWRPPLVAAAVPGPPLVPQPGTPPAAGQARPAGAPAAAAPPPPIQFNNQTIRQIVRVTAAGERLRVALSNAFGTAPIRIGAAHLAPRQEQAALGAGGRPLLFAGEPAVTIPSGASMTSDPVDLKVEAFADIAIDIYLPDNTETSSSPLTVHGGALQTSYVSQTGNHAGEATWEPITTTRSWFLLTRVETSAAAFDRATIVAIGDSITDGTRSTPDTNARWPDELARRLQANPATRHLSVSNAGISGNRLLSQSNPGAGINLLARFDRDVLAQPGVKYVVLLEGINDIGNLGGGAAAPAAALIRAHRQIIDRAHAAGLKIFGATLTPFEGAAYFTAAGEERRQAVNAWIRTSGTYDGVIDFDAAVRDPAAPTKFLPAFNSGDNLHPGDAGYKAMANAIDLALFK